MPSPTRAWGWRRYDVERPTLAMYTLERLLQDAASRTASLASRSVDLQQVWDALNRYITEVIDKRQTLRVLNIFCIGWKHLESGVGGVARLRPHFHLSDSFAQSCNAETGAHPVISEKFLASKEDFNCSKAAIRYSQSLTKDQFFMGLRALWHQLGEVIASGQSISIEFEVGKLLVASRQIHFVFLAELYLREGLAVPIDALEDVDYKPSVTFGPPSEDALSLSLRGSAVATPRSPKALVAKADRLGGWTEEPSAPRGGEVAPPDVLLLDIEGEVLQRLVRPDELAYACGGQAHVPEVDPQDRKVLVYSQAISRGFDDMAREADEASEDRAQWEYHLQRCREEERNQLEWRRSIEKDYQSRLLGQMQEADQRRVEEQGHRMEQAGAHDFPGFSSSSEVPERHRQRDEEGRNQDDLRHQITAKRSTREKALRRDRERDVAHQTANRKEMERLKAQATKKRDHVSAVLREDWAMSVGFTQARRAIEDHHKAPSTDRLASTMGALTGGSPFARTTTPRTPRRATPFAASTPRSLCDPAPASPQQEMLAAGLPTSRPATGSTRRQPLGAAGSLALHKQKLAESLRR